MYFFNGTLLFIYSEMFNKFTAQTEHLGKKNVTEAIAVLKENFTEKLIITLKIAFSCCFSLGGNQDFLDFRQKRL